jgi:imidazolonepropionase-like amidohydrolase
MSANDPLQTFGVRAQLRSAMLIEGARIVSVEGPKSLSKSLLNFLATLILWSCTSQALAQQTVVKAARMLDVATGKMVEPGILVTNGDRIVSIGAANIPASAEVIDLGDATLLPGLIDAHVHLMDEPGSDWIRQRAYETPALWALRAARSAERALLAGFTTVRDIGSTGFVDVAVGKATDSNWIKGPRVVPVGHPITTTGGHCDVTGFAPGILERGTEAGVADGPEEVRKAVRYQIKHGAKWIKMCATAGVFSFEGPVGAQQYSEAELRAGVEEAALHGIRVAAHAHGTEGILAAVRAGVRSIEHGSILSEEAIRLMKARGTWLVPQAYIGQAIDPSTLEPAIRAKHEQITPLAERSLKQAIRSGLKIAFSTDGPLPNNDPGREFDALVKHGMTPLQSIQSATIGGAELIELDDRGQLVPGKIADVIAVVGNPLQNIRTMENVVFVMKGGRVVKRAAQ